MSAFVEQGAATPRRKSRPTWPYPQHAIDRFYRLLDTSAGPDGCHPWTGTIDPHGRATFCIHRSLVFARRFAVQLKLGRELLPAEVTWNSRDCTTTTCCNLDHPIVGSTANRGFYCRLSSSMPEPQPVPGARWVPLTSGQFALVDDADFDAVSREVWHYRLPTHRDYTGYADGRSLSPKRAYLHRFLWERWGLPPTPHIDHRDGNGLDCRRSNLRAATIAQNMANTRLSRNCKSGFKGVSWHSAMKSWRAVIVKDGKQIRLGYFDDKEDAARAHDDAAIKLYGEFACVNFPPVDGNGKALIMAALRAKTVRP